MPTAAELWKSARLTYYALVAIAKVIWHPPVPREVSTARRRGCESCPLADTSGQRLYRFTGVIRTCGQAFWLRPVRDDRDGCGCVLSLKWRGQGQRCPRGRW